jgi:hypothetical protein
LSLIAGAPQSFIQDISQPLYARRPVVPLPQSAMLTPQTQEATMKEEEAPPPAAPSPITGAVGGPVSGVGGGLGGGTFALKAQSRAKHGGREFDRLEQYSMVQNAPPTTDQVSRLEPAAESKDLGDYFEYNIKQPITIGKNQSALVPILQARIDAEKVTLWSANGNQPALRALWVKNSSGLTLDSGTFNIVDNGAFAGEGLIATVHPDERRLLSYAAGTAVRVTSHSEFKNQPVSRIRIIKGVMFMTREQRNKVTYTIRNADTLARQVVIEHPLRDGWKLADDVKPEETSANYYRFRVPVDPGRSNDLSVEEFHPEVTRTILTDITQNQVDVLAAENRITPELQDAFRRVLERKAKISDLQGQLDSRQQRIDSINSDQGRIRENMKALKGSAEEKALLQRYTGQLNSQEDKLASLRSQIDDLQKQKDQANAELELTIMNINMDQKF